MKAFVTGSRVYGDPRPDSDVDLVVRCSAETARTLAMVLEPSSDSVPLEKRRGFRAGKLNLIACDSERVFNAWRAATDELCQLREWMQRPVTRAEAIVVHQRHRAEAGVTGFAEYAPAEALHEPIEFCVRLLKGT